MQYLTSVEARGDVVALMRTDPRHFGGLGKGKQVSEGPEAGFAELLFRAVGNVNASQHTGMELSQMLITDPDQVDIHDVTIALAEANLSLSMTKTIADRAIQAYREIMNTR